MPLPKSKKLGNLGKAIIRDRFKGNTRPRDDATTPMHTTDLDDGPNWTKMQSITEEGDLDAFLRTAQLAGTEFTAEKLNIKVVTNDYHNPFLLTQEKEQETLQKQEENRERLTVPRRPYWDKNTTAEQLQRDERESFLDWRRDLAMLQENHGLLLTPFEKNIEVWRQLWRVIERSDLVVQIVDARNPSFFRSTDLEKYVKEVDPTKKNLLLINKADMLTAKQRAMWADYFDSQEIDYTFFSAALANKKLEDEEKEREALEDLLLRAQLAGTIIDEDDSEEDQEEEEEEEKEEEQVVEEEESEEEVEIEGKPYIHKHYESQDDSDERIRIRTAGDLLDLFDVECPVIEGRVDGRGQTRKANIGLVGYPNVGKSSTINALVGEKKVAVGATPGKTKHFQTIHLSESILLCDCPGLVFPSFAITQADMVCNGVLPIDQMREYTGPAALIAQRIPKWYIEATYGFHIKTKPKEEGGSGTPTGEELLIAFARARGYTKSSQGNPDESKAARFIFKDYVNGKLLYNHPPPTGIEPEEFNVEIYDPKKFEQRKRFTAVAAAVALAEGDEQDTETIKAVAPVGSTSSALDNNFFHKTHKGPQVVGKFAKQNFNRVKLYPHQQMVANDGSYVGVQGQAPSETGKKAHKKGKKHVKVRSRMGYDIA
ncbi:hypothetical protein K7432_010267 [Basidiobolus ranarum]|uniref:CP-type G domain-containing protein n=1 Tax=Basidiobolus ranarum TaxID=34480 RepID=A0ABR2VVQ4_9FUNG